MVIVFRAFHIYIWVAFVGFFLPLVVAFASRNAARFAFLETQDCIFRRVTVLWGDSGDGGDSSFGIPPADCRNCHPHPLHDGHVDDDGVFGIPPSQEPSPSCRHSFIRSRKAQDSRAQPCLKGVQRERLAHDFAGQSVVCYTL